MALARPGPAPAFAGEVTGVLTGAIGASPRKDAERATPLLAGMLDSSGTTSTTGAHLRVAHVISEAPMHRPAANKMHRQGRNEHNGRRPPYYRVPTWTDWIS